MKRRRQGLQVSTFPFLAVLLCAMGSLILLLLVIDRRARAVAQARALQSVAQVAATNARADAARQAEWERRRRALHALLTQQDQQLRAQVRTVAGQGEAQEAGLHDEAQRYHDLERQLRAERARLSQGKSTLSAWRQATVRKAGEKEAARKDLVRLTEELHLLEQTVEDLKLLRRRAQQTYSLVPYRGRRGDSRKPIYVECTADSLIFHPDQVVLQGARVTAGDVHAEVERQIAHQRRTSVPVAGKKAELPYLLLLVRPDGITTYYHTLTALAGFKFDYGYEFVERNWILDFSGDGRGPEPWLTAGAAGAQQKIAPARAKRPPLARATGLAGTGEPGASAPGGNSPQGGVQASEPGASAFGGNSPGTDVPGSPKPGLPPRGVAFTGEPGTNALGSSGKVAAGPRPTGGLLFSAPVGQQPPSGAGPGVAPAGQPRGTTFGKGVTGLAGGRPDGSGDPAGLAAAPSGPGPGAQHPVGAIPSAPAPPWLVRKSEVLTPEQAQSGPHADSGLAETIPPQRSGADGQAASAIVPRRSPLSAESPNPGPATPPSGGEQPADSSSGNAGRTGVPGTAGARSARLTPGDGGTPAAAGSGPGGEGEGERGSGSSGASFTQLMPRSRGGRPVRQPPPPLSSVIGNREWIIPIECTADSVVLRTGRLSFPVATLPRSSGGEHELAQAVRQMISRRQALLRSGEPPYRPMIRFQVRPDGLRSYYLAYPLLERLRVPMSRQDLEPEKKERK